MKTRKDVAKLLLAAAVAGALSLGAAGVVAKGNPGAKSVDQLTANWWQWQEAYYPAFDFGGDYPDCSYGQTGEIWYLGGTGPSAEPAPIIRTCMDPVPAGKRLFFPLLNITYFNGEGEETPVDVKRAILEGLFSDVDPATGLEACNLSAYVDDVPVIFSGTPIQRVQSPPFAYAGDAEAVSDGFWVLLPYLPPGPHAVRFTGSLCYFGTAEPADLGGVTLEVDVTYEVSIVE